jgi:hypothetical protein
MLPEGIEKLDLLTPETARQVRRLLRYAASQGIVVERIEESYRTCSRQNALYAQGITPARGCRSWHGWGRAVDLYVPRAYESPPPRSVVEDYGIMGDWWKLQGGVWGGDFGYGDLVHYEWHPEWESVSALCPSWDSACGAPPWPDDRPWLVRHGPIVGAAMGLIGLGAAYHLIRS